MKLLTESNTKTMKGEAAGYKTYILHLAPGNLSGFQVCASASPGCLAACLNTAGRGKFDRTQNARIRKTQRFFTDRDGFLRDLVKDIEAGIRKASREDLIPVFRLNGTSDIRWETIPVVRQGFTFRNLMAAFPNVTFYDYTKHANRKNIPMNYHLTFSRSESNDDLLPTALANGMNVAVVFDTKKKFGLPTKHFSLPVVDGDVTDLRFLDPAGCIVGLRGKGMAKNDSYGFVVKV